MENKELLFELSQNALNFIQNNLNLEWKSGVDYSEQYSKYEIVGTDFIAYINNFGNGFSMRCRKLNAYLHGTSYNNMTFGCGNNLSEIEVLTKLLALKILS